MNRCPWKSLLVLVILSAWIGAAMAQVGLNLAFPNHHGFTTVVVEPLEHGETPNDAGPESRLLRTWHAHDRCYGTAKIIFGHSSHPDSRRYQQNNKGDGGRCYLDQAKRYYWVMAGLTNSQDGSALELGFGARWPIIELRPQFLENRWHIPINRVALYVGGEAGSLYYEQRFSRGAKLAPFIFPTLALSVQFGQIEITAMQVYLIDGIKLWGHTVDLPRALSGEYRSSWGPLDYVPAGFDQRPHARPTVFLHWRF